MYLLRRRSSKLITQNQRENALVDARILLCRIALAALLLTAQANSASSHEVDHYQLPHGVTLIDRGDEWDAMLYTALLKAVVSTNEEIRQANHEPIPEKLRKLWLAQLYSPERLTWKVRQNLPAALTGILGWEWKTHVLNRSLCERGEAAGFFAPITKSTYADPLLSLDPRHYLRLTISRSSLVKIHGVYMGTDKIGHFVAMGYLYYLHYQTLQGIGAPPDAAASQTIDVWGRGLFSEGGALGVLSTGVFSNADLAANYVGMKFYLNITRPTYLQGKLHPPLVTLTGGYWRLQPHARPSNGHFAYFVSHHYDEALNPSVYDPILKRRMRPAIERRKDAVIHWYAQEHPGGASPDWCAAMLRACATYYGEDYGHYGGCGQLITIQTSHTTPGQCLRK